MSGATLVGARQLESRLQALKPTAQMHRELALAVLGFQKHEAPVRTGNLRRSIRLGHISARVAQTVATAGYAVAVEYGTRPHDIVPVNRKALRFAAQGEATTLGGRVRSGGRVQFAKRVRHPGTRANPFMERGAQMAKRAGIIKDYLIRAWNLAA